MRGLRKVFLAGLLLLVAAAAEGKPLDKIGAVRPVERVGVGLRDVVDTVEKSYQHLTDVRADFFQRSTLAGKEKEYRANGEMSLKPPGREPPMFRFDYLRPTTQEIVCNGTKLWTYLPENRQAIYSDVGFVFNPAGNSDAGRWGAGNFIQGLGRISRDFTITFASEMYDIEGNFVLELQPHRQMVFIQKLFMVVDRHAVLNFVQDRNGFMLANNQELLFPILSTTAIDHQGNTTTMEFSNIRTNTGLPLSIFEFHLPAGIDVVKPPTGPGH